MSRRGNFHKDEEVDVAIREWSRMPKSDIHRDEMFELFLRWGSCFSMVGEIMLRSTDS